MYTIEEHIKALNERIEERKEWCKDTTATPEDVRKWLAQVATDQEMLRILNSIKESEGQSSSKDLEEEMEKFFKGWTEDEENGACNYQRITLGDCKRIARHFANWQQRQDQGLVEIAMTKGILEGAKVMRESHESEPLLAKHQEELLKKVTEWIAKHAHRFKSIETGEDLVEDFQSYMSQKMKED